MPKTKPGDFATQDIQQLQKRYNDLQHAKTRAETNRDNARKRLDELKTDAREKFGTDDVKQLELQLAKLKSENETKRGEYEKQLDQVEQKLVEIEEKFVDLDDLSYDPTDIQTFQDE